MDLQTLFYRAPEILFGDQHYGVAIDVWSVGLVLAELAACRFHRGATAAAQAQATPLSHAQLLCRFFGRPPVTNLRTPPAPPDAGLGRPQWPRATLESLGLSGRHMLEGCLAWSGSARWCARAALDSHFLTPARFVLGGTTGEQDCCHMFGGGLPGGVCLCVFRVAPPESASGGQQIGSRNEAHKPGQNMG